MKRKIPEPTAAAIKAWLLEQKAALDRPSDYDHVGRVRQIDLTLRHFWPDGIE